MTTQRVRLVSLPVGPALLTGAWAGFVPGLFLGGLAGTLASFGAGAVLEWMRELSFTTGIQQQLLPFGDRTGLLQTVQDDWWIAIPAAALVVGLFAALVGALTGALVASSFGSILRGVEIEVQVEPIATEHPASPRPVEKYRRAVGDS